MEIMATMKYNKNGEIESVLLSRESFLALITTGKVSITAVDANNDKRLENTEAAVSQILTSIGVPKHVKGFVYLREAIITCANDFSTIKHITKVMYPRIAGSHNDTPSRVERAIRHAIESMWSSKNVRKVNELYGTSYDFDERKPTNSEFIALIADSLRMNVAV